MTMMKICEILTVDDARRAFRYGLLMAGFIMIDRVFHNLDVQRDLREWNQRAEAFRRKQERDANGTDQGSKGQKGTYEVSPATATAGAGREANDGSFAQDSTRPPGDSGK
jgi:hypothetical protein